MSNMSDQTDKRTRLIVGEVGVDTETGIVGKGHSYDNGKTFTVDDTIYGRIYHADDHGKIWQGIQDQVAKVVAPAKSAADSAQRVAIDTASALDNTKQDLDDVKKLVVTAKTTADQAVKSAASVASDLTVVANQAKATAGGLTEIKSSVGQIEAAVADNSGNIAMIQETTVKIQKAVSDNAGAITVATQTAQGAVTVASDAKSDATVARQTASEASMTAKNASGQAASVALIAQGAVATANNAKSDATVAVQTANEFKMVATNAQSDATVAKQTASEVSVAVTNAQDDITVLQARAGKIEASVAGKADQANLTLLSNSLQTKVSSDEFTSITNQLKDSINLSVKKGGLLSQINVEAGRTLIQSGNIVLSGDTVTFDIEKAFIPAAAISSLTADKISSGTLKGVDVDFRNDQGVGMQASGAVLTFNDTSGATGHLAFNGMPIADWPDGSGGNEMQLLYKNSFAIAPIDTTDTQATFSKASTKFGYLTGTDIGTKKLSGMVIGSNSHHWLGSVNSDGTWNRLEINSANGVNLTWHDRTHFWLDEREAHLYQDGDGSATATKLQVDGWAWVKGWVEAAGHSTHSTLSSKTDIRSFDTAEALSLIDETDLTTFRYKAEKDGGVIYDHYGPIIDNVHEVLQYRMPEAFISPTRTARDDSNIVGALMGAVQELHKQVKELRKKIGTDS